MMRALLTTAVVLTLLGCGEPDLGSEQSFTRSSANRHPAADRVIALGDVHGDIAAMRRALRLADVIDDQDTWTGGETVVVQTGDLLDRGDDEQEIIDVLLSLQQQAASAGGALHLLQGNHELMNVAWDFGYVTDAGFEDFEDAPGAEPDHPEVADFEPHERARASVFMPGGSYATKIAHFPVVLIVGDTAFTHGGVLPSYASEMEDVNKEVSTWLRGGDDAGYRIYEDDDSPVWSRHYSDAPSKTDCKKLDRALEILGVEYMVVGHTVQERITAACSDRVWMVDVGMSAYYEGPVEVLELTADTITVLTE